MMTKIVGFMIMTLLGSVSYMLYCNQQTYLVHLRTKETDPVGVIQNNEHYAKGKQSNEFIWHKLFINDLPLYVVGAYLDTRNVSRQVVRISALSNQTVLHGRGNKPMVDIYCSFKYRNGSSYTTRVFLTRPIDGIPPFLGDHPHFQYLLSCDITDNLELGEVFIYTETESKAAQLSIIRPKPEYKGLVCVCVPPFYGNFAEDPKEATALIEYMELNKMLGVGEVFLYNATLYNTHDNYMKVIDYYERQGYVKYYQMGTPLPLSEIEVHKHSLASRVATRSTLNDCMFKNMFSYDLIFIGDVDEFVFPKNFPDFQQWHENFVQNYSLDEFGKFCITPQHFAMHLPPVEGNNKSLSIVSKYNQYLTVSNGYINKCIVNPRNVDSIWNHGTYPCPMGQAWCQKTDQTLPETIFKLHHFRRRSLVDRDPDKRGNMRPSKRYSQPCETITDNHLQQYSSRLEQRIKQVLNELDLPHQSF